MIHKRCRDLLHRWESNPIITLENVPFQCNTIFNGAPVKIDNEYLLLLRVEGQHIRSSVWLEVKTDFISMLMTDHVWNLPVRVCLKYGKKMVLKIHA